MYNLVIGSLTEVEYLKNSLLGKEIMYCLYTLILTIDDMIVSRNRFFAVKILKGNRV